MLKVFHAMYRKSYGWGAYDDKDYVVVANTESEALGLSLELVEDSTAGDWVLTTVSTEQVGTLWISERSSS